MRIFRKVCFTAAAVACISLGSAQAARADIILTPGNIPQTDENVLLNTGVTGNPLFGVTNQTQLQVKFTGEELLTAPANGQARIEAADLTPGINNDFFTYLRVELVAGSFTSLILNIDSTINGTVDFTAVDTMGDIFTFNNVALGGSGENFFTFTTINGQRIAFIEFRADAPLEFVDGAQFRIGGAQQNPPDRSVPEPTSMMLLGSGLFGLAAASRLRKAAK